MCALVACRMCLAVGKRMRSIAGTPLEDFYEKITNIQLENKYGKPVLGCNVCLHLLKKCQTFIEDVGRADETLTRICGAGSEISEQSRLLADVAKPRASLGLSGVKCAWYDPRQPPDCKVKIEVEIESEYSPGNTATSAVASTSDSMALKAPGTAELCKIKIEPEEVEEPPADDTDPVDERYRSYPQPPLHALSPDCILGATPEWRAEAQPSGRGKNVSIGKRSKSNEALKKPETKRFKPPLSNEVICSSNNNYSEPDTAPRTPELFAVDKNNLLEYRKEISYYECSYCNKAFSKKSILTSHIRTHTGEKPYQCSHCGKAFSQKSHLTIHIRTHTGEKPHQCSHCSKAFSEKRNLTSHIRTHTGEKPYQCSHCSKAFSYKCNLTNHIRTHTGAKQYRCSHCSKAFMHNSSLTKHVRTHHRRSVGESSGCPTSPPPLT